MSAPSPADLANRRPYTHVIADAIAELDGVGEAPLNEALDRLSATSEVLARVLETSADTVQTSIPGLRDQ